MWIHNSIEASAGADGKCYKTWRNRERSDLFCVVRGRDVRNFCADKVSALARILPNTHDLRCEDISARMFDHPADLYREIRSCRDYASWWRLTVGGMREREREELSTTWQNGRRDRRNKRRMTLVSSDGNKIRHTFIWIEIKSNVGDSYRRIHSLFPSYDCLKIIFYKAWTYVSLKKLKKIMKCMYLIIYYYLKLIYRFSLKVFSWFFDKW